MINSMEEIFKEFYKLFSDRCDHIPLLEMGEDSIRYDFFMALNSLENLKNYEIILESAIDKRSFQPRSNMRSYRKEKPKMDLVVDKLNICLEFGLFRQNSNDEGTINKTARLVKMLNDMIRLGIEKHHTGRSAFFVCVADSKMLGHQLRSKILPRFPSNYIINHKVIEKQCESKTSNFDFRFIEIMKSLNLSLNANLVFEKEILSNKINLETRMLIWEIE